jgi:hypothetical protein
MANATGGGRLSCTVLDDVVSASFFTLTFASPSFLSACVDKSPHPKNPTVTIT